MHWFKNPKEIFNTDYLLWLLQVRSTSQYSILLFNYIWFTYYSSLAPPIFIVYIKKFTASFFSRHLFPKSVTAGVRETRNLPHPFNKHLQYSFALALALHHDDDDDDVSSRLYSCPCHTSLGSIHVSVLRKLCNRWGTTRETRGKRTVALRPTLVQSLYYYTVRLWTAEESLGNFGTRRRLSYSARLLSSLEYDVI